MTESTYEKADIARSQLDTAIRLFREGEDLFAVITLAGAAEEILGRLIEEAGGENSLEALRDASVRIHQALFQETRAAKVFAERANRARNALKHHTLGVDSTVTLDLEREAIDMVDRAISNYWRLHHDLTDAMKWLTETQRRSALDNAHIDPGARDVNGQQIDTTDV